MTPGDQDDEPLKWRTNGHPWKEFEEDHTEDEEEEEEEEEEED